MDGRPRPFPKGSHYTRPLTLPSGRRIDVVYYDPTPAREQSDEQDLHRCGGCGSELVQPVDWAPTSRSYWSVTLRCPNCEWSGTGVFEQDVVDRYDEELNRGETLLTGELERLSLENMASSVERFVAALKAGHIFPSDF